jgi:hypothetical protein
MRHPRLFLLILLASLICCWSWNVRAQSVDRSLVEKEINDLYAQIRSKENLFLAPSPEDHATFSEYLNQSDKGIIRLLPREKYDNKLSIRGGGAYYSFVRLTHEYGYGSDIELSREEFSVGFAGYDFGFLIDVGALSLEEITLEHPALKFLTTFTPALVEPEIRAQQRQSGQGIQAGEFNYTRRVPVKVGHAYLLRSIDYDTSDVIVAFQALRQEADGSVVLIWKMLKKLSPPKPERPKQN